ncbi:hypothetical protein [Roseofilum casamattae]|uniref:Uncharacterized protein n=1 Tax=Roseofilum casamattae BLCC-M143 TaxID=3022442 RepID=A0ABT7BUC5_9CYAN|nr:hypothetical protein [Roseofilum casamattae]MDJ1182119.1 hypothetical protein [Roseofilum casamattae BLCC-M143]
MKSESDRRGVIADELAEALEAEVQAKQEAIERAEAAQEQTDRLQALLARYQEQFGILDDSIANGLL